MSFEDRLLRELRSVVTANGGEPRRRLPWAAPRRVAAVGAAAAAVAVAAVAAVQFVSGGAEPAYAVNTNDDGTVTVEIASLSDAAGLESKLREAGIPAVVQYLPPGKACKQPWPTGVSDPGGASSPGGKQAIRGGVEHTSDGHTRFTISRNLPADVTLVIMTQVGPTPSGTSETRSPSAIAVALARGSVQPCQVVDAPAGAPPLGPAPAGAQVHTEGGPGGTDG
jgi:hypothetical protein